MKNLPFLTLLFLFVFPLCSQERPLNTGLSNEEQYSFVGMTLQELIECFGSPRTVAVARGNEIWQDDVVFQYTGVDFFIHRDRVWQVKFVTTHGVSNGDRKQNVLRAIGSSAEDMGDHIIMTITGRDWPLILRVNFNNSSNTGQVTAIFLYRPDF